MKSLTSTSELNKIIKQQVGLLAEVDPSVVRDSTLYFGAEFNKDDDSILTSFNPDDTFIFFASGDRETTSQTSFTEEDGSIVYYKAYQYNLYIYGENGCDVANKLVARLRSESVRNAFHEQGIHIESVSNPVQLREFVNELVWMREDVNIDLSVKLKIDQLSDYQTFTDLTEFNIVKAN